MNSVAAARGYLVVTSGGAPRVIVLPPGSITAGRSPDAAIELAHLEISRHHCQFDWDGEICTVEDLGSMRGTRVNGLIISARTPLNPGDRIAIGPAVLEFGIGEPPQIREEAAEKSAARPIVVNGVPSDRIPCNTELTIGRDPEGAVVLDDPSVSRRHARVSPLPRGGALVADLNSRAGSFVNGRRFDEHELTVGDRLQIGPFAFTFDGQSLVRVANAAGSAIRAIGINFRAGNRLILDDITTAIPPARFVGIIGPSGAGKSSLLNVLAGLAPPASGVVLVDGHDIYAANVAYSFGFVPQEDIVHLDLTVAQALHYSARLRLARGTPRAAIEKLIGQTMEQLGLRGFADRRIANLSGGQRKRVSVGVELLAKPALLFLDEPSSGLDPATEFDLMELLRNLADTGCTIVCTTHVMENAWLIDELIVLVGGCLAFQGSPEETRDYFDVGKLTALYEELDTRTPKEWQEAVAERRAPPAPITPGTPIARRRSGWSMPVLLRRQGAILSADWKNFGLLLGQPLIIAALVSWVSNDQSLILFFAYLATLWLGCSNAAQEIVKEIAIYRRERLVGVGAHSYLVSKFVFLGLVTAAQALVLYAALYALEGPNDGALAWQLTGLCGIALAAVAIGCAISALARSVMQAVMIVPLILIPLILFSGQTVPVVDMSTPVHRVSRFTPTFAAQTAMDGSFLWRKLLASDVIRGHRQSLSNLRRDFAPKTGEIFTDKRPLLFTVANHIAWTVGGYFVAFIALRRRER
jgi:ABC-type multidrug transport system ATPase subunit/pSer/pThr/pTyr-binding forkhead associated (FHA) protein